MKYFSITVNSLHPFASLFLLSVRILLCGHQSDRLAWLRSVDCAGCFFTCSASLSSPASSIRNL